MTLTEHVQWMVVREIRPYILPLLFSNYDNPAMIAEHVSDEDWLRWLGYWASCYIPLRTVCKVFRSLHLGELLMGNIRRSREAHLRLRTLDEAKVAVVCMRKFMRLSR